MDNEAIIVQRVSEGADIPLAEEYLAGGVAETFSESGSLAGSLPVATVEIFHRKKKQSDGNTSFYVGLCISGFITCILVIASQVFGSRRDLVLNENRSSFARVCAEQNNSTEYEAVFDKFLTKLYPGVDESKYTLRTSGIDVLPDFVFQCILDDINSGSEPQSLTIILEGNLLIQTYSFFSSDGVDVYPWNSLVNEFIFETNGYDLEIETGAMGPTVFSRFFTWGVTFLLNGNENLKILDSNFDAFTTVNIIGKDDVEVVPTINFSLTFPYDNWEVSSNISGK
eukprot:maker-scaffold_8-snap-gene-2.21-mRNA-1 protein AED:0.16 eAED:0.18 QI:50/0/0.5/1/0/0/2/0/282